MNSLDLILENIRLGHINALLLEAKSEDEIIRGVNIINESMQLLAGSLMEEMQHAGTKYDKANSSYVQGMMKTQVPVVSKTMGTTVMVEREVPSQVPNDIMSNRMKAAKMMREDRRRRDNADSLREKNFRDNLPRIASQNIDANNSHSMSYAASGTSIFPFMRASENSGIINTRPRMVPITKAGIAAQEQEARDLKFV